MMKKTSSLLRTDDIDVIISTTSGSTCRICCFRGGFQLDRDKHSAATRAPHMDPASSGRRRRGAAPSCEALVGAFERSEEHTSELQSLMRISYAVFCLKKKKTHKRTKKQTYKHT